MSAKEYNDTELQMDSQLILCVEENDNKSVDTRLFIGWSTETNDYFVRGKRQDVGQRKFVPYALHFEQLYSLLDFIKFTACGNDSYTVILYNYNNLDSVKDKDLTYEFFEADLDRNYEVAAYDNISKFDRRRFKGLLTMLKNSYNWTNN